MAIQNEVPHQVQLYFNVMEGRSLHFLLNVFHTSTDLQPSFSLITVTLTHSVLCCTVARNKNFRLWWPCSSQPLSPGQHWTPRCTSGIRSHSEGRSVGSPFQCRA